MKELQTIIKNINNIRNSQNLSIEKLANLSNIPVSTLSKYLAGITTDPHISLLLKLCKGLNCSIEELVTNNNIIKFKKLQAIAYNDEALTKVEVNMDEFNKFFE